MHRRSFFSALLGAPAAAALPAPSPTTLLAQAQIPDCVCGHRFRLYVDDIHKLQYMACSNRSCVHWRRPWMIPTVQLTRADPHLVRQVNQAERDREQYLTYTPTQYTVGFTVSREILEADPIARAAAELGASLRQHDDRVISGILTPSASHRDPTVP